MMVAAAGTTPAHTSIQQLVGQRAGRVYFYNREGYQDFKIFEPAGDPAGYASVSDAVAAAREAARAAVVKDQLGVHHAGRGYAVLQAEGDRFGLATVDSSLWLSGETPGYKVHRKGEAAAALRAVVNGYGEEIPSQGRVPRFEFWGPV